MIVLPLQRLLSLFLGLLALGILAASTYLFFKALKHPTIAVRKTSAGTVAAASALPLGAGRRRRAVLLTSAAFLLMLGSGGRHLVAMLQSSNPQDAQHESGSTRKIRGASGADLTVEESGPSDAPRLIFTHGWGLDRREWDWARRQLSQDFRVITWDLPGLGESSAIPNGDYALEKLAGELDSVVEQTGVSPAVLVGHSIGGMINLTFCRSFQQRLGKRWWGWSS